MKTRNLAAYAAWMLALVAILMPPAMAEAGLATLSRAEGAIFSMLEAPAPTAIADLAVSGAGDTTSV